LPKFETKKTSKIRSLTITLAIAFFGLSAIVLIIASSLELYFNFQSQKKLVATQQQLIAQEATNSVKGFIQKKFRVVETASRIGNLANTSQEEQKLVLNKIMGLEPAFRQLILLNAQGLELQRVARVSQRVFTQSTGLYETEMFSQLSQGKTFISPVYIDEVTSEPLMVIAVPVTDVFGVYERILVAELELKFMWDLVGGMKIGKTGVAYVVDKQGNLIAFGDISRVLKGENLVHLQEVAEFVQGNVKIHKSHADISKGINGNRVVASHVHLGSPDWAVVIELPALEAYQTVITALKRSILFILICFALATLVGIYLSKKITKPIIDLRDATRRISKGDLDTQIEIVSNDEIGELAISLNQMVEDLNRTTVSRDELAKEVLERKKVEEALREAKQQAEAASEAQSQFLANMSHEIRTPMNAILGFTRLLRDTSLDEVQSDHVKTMDSSGNLLLTLINDILDLSKVEGKRFELECIDFDFMYLIESVFSMIRSRMAGSSVDLLYRMEEEPRYFKGDPTRIRQIMINLIGNAIKFTEEGEVFATIGVDPSDGYGDGEPGMSRTLRVSIRDTGIGIPADKRESIFEKFTQADTSTTRKYGGTGLGLSITKAFVEKMGGKIWVESEEGKGSEFIFTLRLTQAKPIMEAEIEPISFESLKGKRVVIVDDNHHTCEIFREYCITAKMDVQFVSHSAKKTLSFLASEETLPDLVICDMMMPEMDGYEFIENIRRDVGLRHLKVIAATSDAIPGQSMDAKMKGFDGYLVKPFIRKELINVIRTVFGDKRKERSHIITRHLAEEVYFKGMKVLVVEDNPINMKLMEVLLEKYGLIIDKANNGKEAVEKLRGNTTYNVVLMDVQMPEMNGIEATEVIRKDINKEIPIIALTAGVMQDDRKHALVAGMNDFLEKPVDVDRLKEVLQKYCA
jgi:signal transduction histidine kinase/DNA-binding response OmpR family regulator